MMEYEVIEEEGAARPDNTGSDASKNDGSTVDGSTVDDRSASGTASTIPTPGGTSANQWSEGSAPSASYDSSVTPGTDPSSSGVVPVSGTETSSWTALDDLPHYDDEGNGPLTAAQVAALDDTGAGWWAAVVASDGTDRAVWVPYTEEELFAIEGPGRMDEVEQTVSDIPIVTLSSTNGTVFKRNLGVDTTIIATIFTPGGRIDNAAELHSRFGAGAYLEWGWRDVVTDADHVLLSSDPRISQGGFALTVSPDDIDVQAVITCSLNY